MASAVTAIRSVVSVSPSQQQQQQQQQQRHRPCHELEGERTTLSSSSGLETTTATAKAMALDNDDTIVSRHASQQQRPQQRQQQRQRPETVVDSPQSSASSAEQLGLSLSIGSYADATTTTPSSSYPPIPSFRPLTPSKEKKSDNGITGGIDENSPAVSEIAATTAARLAVSDDDAAIASAVEGAAAAMTMAEDDDNNDDDDDDDASDDEPTTASLLPRRRRETLPPPPPLRYDDSNNSNNNSNSNNNNDAPTTSAARSTHVSSSQTSTQAVERAAMEGRILQLEQSLGTITMLCQTLLLQQQQQREEQHQRARTHSSSREGSVATNDAYTPPGGNSSPTTVPSPTSNQSSSRQFNDSDPRLLSQWPPSHTLLESPDVYRSQMRLQQQQNRSSRKVGNRRSSSASRSSLGGNRLSASWSGESDGMGMPHSKTMSMVLLDIGLGENRGPNMIPFTSDLDACDEMDGDSVAGGCRAGGRGGGGGGSRSGSDGDVTTGESSRLSVRLLGGSGRDGRRRRGKDAGGSNSRSGSETPSTDSSHSHGSCEKDAPRQGSGGVEDGTDGSSNKSRLQESGRRENNLECQAFTNDHLEALRLRREAGKGRAYSLNDSDLVRSAAVKSHGDGGGQWKPTLGSVNSTGDPDSAMSVISTGTFVSVGDPKGLDINIPDLSEKKETKKKPRRKSVESNTADILPHSTSCASNMSSQTLKSGNLNNLRAQKLRENRVERSQSIASSKSEKSSTSTKDDASSHAPADAANAISTTTPSKKQEAKGKSPHKNESKGRTPRKSSESETKKGKSSHKQPQQQQQQHADAASSAVVAADGNKNNQTMKDYVVNDLLNIDSRNHDGSATEDIDEAMEEFLRVPHKLEGMMVFSLAVCMDSFLYVWAMLPLKFLWGWVCLACSVLSFGRGLRGIRFRRRHLYPIMQSVLIYFVYSQVLCPISIGKLYHWIRGQAMLKLYVLIAIVEVFDRLFCSFGQDAWDSLYWNTTRRPRHPRMFVSIIVVGVYVTIHSLFLFVHVATLSVAVNSADNALLTLLISGNFAEIKSTVFKKYNKQNLFKITTSDICERFKLALFLLLILFLNRFQGEMTSSMVKDYYSMCGIVFGAELICDWIKHSFITKFNFIKSTIYFDYALILSGDVTGIGHEGLNLDYTHAAVKRLGLAQIPLVCVTARYLHEAVRFAIAFQGNGDVDHPVAALVELMAEGNKWKFYTGLLQGLVSLVVFKIVLGMCIRYVARGYLGGASDRVLKGGGASSSSSSSSRKNAIAKTPKESEVKKKQ